MVETESQWVVRRPSAALAPFIDHYVGYRILGPAGVHRGLPSRHLTLIVSIGPTIDVAAQTDRSQAPQRYRCVLGGLQASPALITYDGTQEGVAIELTPTGCRSVFAMPARALWNTSLELGDVVGSAGDELWERLQLVSTWDERFAICDQVLGRLRGDDVVAPELRHGWRLLTGSGGTIPVAEVAATVGWSRQHLARRFTDEFGLAPKLAARVARFERAKQLLQSTGTTSIATVAATCGYYDQAHLTHDFVELAGCPPSRLLAEELPSFQDGDGARPAP